MTNFRKLIAESIYPENVKLISKLQSDLNNIKVELEKFKPSYTEDYYNNKYPKVDITYSRKETDGEYFIDVRDFFMPNDSSVKKIVDSLKLSNLSDDEKAVKILFWIIDNVKYISDKIEYGYDEYWSFPYQSIKRKKADCEDMSILFANMCLIANIPYWKVRINAGIVQEVKGNKLGHCYPLYYDETNDKWVIMDLCFYPNKLSIKDRKEYKTEDKYKEVWFSFNQRYAYAKDVKDIVKIKQL